MLDLQDVTLQGIYHNSDSLDYLGVFGLKKQFMLKNNLCKVDGEVDFCLIEFKVVNFEDLVLENEHEIEFMRKFVSEDFGFNDDLLELVRKYLLNPHIQVEVLEVIDLDFSTHETEDHYTQLFVKIHADNLLSIADSQRILILRASDLDFLVL